MGWRRMLSFLDFIFKLKRCVLVMSISRAALDAEMRKCVAELQMLGGQKSVSMDKGALDAKLDAIVNDLKALYRNVPGENAYIKSAAGILYHIVGKAANDIKPSDIHDNNGWSIITHSVSNVVTMMKLLAPFAPMIHANFTEICSAIVTELRINSTAADSTPDRVQFINGLLNALGDKLNGFENDDDTFYNFLGIHAKASMQSLIKILKQ